MLMLLEADALTMGKALSSVVTADMINGVFSEILGLLPVLLPCTVAFAGLRKGLSFIKATIKGA